MAAAPAPSGSATDKSIPKLSGASLLAVIELRSRTGASVQAALRRLIQGLDLEVLALLCSQQGTVLDCFSHGAKFYKYRVTLGYTLEPSHPCRVTVPSLGRIEHFRAAVPYANGNRTRITEVQAAHDAPSGRQLCFFYSHGQQRG